VRDDLMIQDYLTGIGGGDVTASMITEVLADLAGRGQAENPLWMGIETQREVH
jgi:hypothetical protein